MSLNHTNNRVKNILTASLFNLRQASSTLSLDEFILHTIESLMQIERDEYLADLSNNGI